MSETKKYDATVGSMIALLKYGTGMPFNREETLQAGLGVPLPASTQWDIVNAQAKRAEPVFEELIRQAAQGGGVHHDDTGVKILEVMGARARQAAWAEETADTAGEHSAKSGSEGSAEGSPQKSKTERTGTFTSGIVAIGEGRQIALFFSGRQQGKGLAKRTKSELIAVLVELVKEDRNVLRRLDAQFELDASPQELVVSTHQAIADATDFDERDINRNFGYDGAAYEEVKRNLTRLVDLGQLRLAMALSLELMDQGSYQVEMSDEGLMAQDIEDCLMVVMKALKRRDLPKGEKIAWCAAMVKRDRVGFICDQELQTLRNQFEAAQS
ncbi:MAG: IS66 family transposase [Thermoguttaceae bacterium]